MGTARHMMRQTTLAALLILGLLAGTARANAACDGIRNVVALSALGARMMADPSKTYSTSAARNVAELRAVIERRALRKMLDAQYKSIYFPEIMGYFAKLVELSNIIRLYGTTEMRRYIQREKLDLQAVEMDQMIRQLCAPAGAAAHTASAGSISRLITRSYTTAAQPVSAAQTGLDWRSLALVVLATLPLAIIGQAFVVGRTAARRSGRSPCWISASLQLERTRIFGHLRRLDGASGQFACNPMQQQVAELALRDAAGPVLELGEDRFEVRIAPGLEGQDSARTEFSFDQPLPAPTLDAILSQTAPNPAPKRKWRDRFGPRHVLKTFARL